MANKQTEPHWKTDFSPDWEQTSYITRREFTRFLALGSAGMAVGNLVMAGVSTLRTESPRPRLEIALVDAIKPHSFHRFEYPASGHHALLMRHEDGSLSAYSQRCPHLGCSVFFSEESQKLECPCHEGFFDPRTGDVLAGPPQRGLAKIELEVSEGTIYAIGGGEG